MKQEVKISMKLFAFIMALLMLLVSLPISAFASAINDALSDENNVISNADSETVKKDVIVLEEDEALRDENTKHFKLSDGTTKAVVYSQAVHYKDADGKWVDIDNALSLNGSEYSSNNKSEIKFANKSGSNGLVSIKDGDYKIDFTPLNTNKVSVVIENPQGNNSRKFEDMSVLNNLVSKAIYADIYDGIDIEYILVGNNIKENIIVKEKQNSYTFSFELKLNKLSAELKDGTIILSDYDSGEQVYEIPVPYMFDANNVYSDSVEYSLVQNNKWKYTFTVTADAEWINSDDRAFPVTIDPAIFIGAESVVDDTTINPNGDSLVENPGDWDLLVAGQTATAYWKANTLPKIADYSFVTDVTFNLNFHSSHVTVYSIISLREVLSDWDESTLCYDLYQQGYGKIGDKIYSRETDPTGTRVGVFSWNITELYMKWVNNPESNFGIAIAEDPNYMSWNNYRFYSSESSGSLAPNLCITYKSLNGLEEYWSYTMQNVGMAGNSYINNATGSLYFSAGTLTTTDSLFGFTPCLIYNQGYAGQSAIKDTLGSPYTTGMYGYGFKLNVNETLIENWYYNEKYLANTKYYIWSDTDGTDHAFYAQVENGKQVYKDEDGLLLTLEEQDGTYTITDLSKNVRTFTKKNDTSLPNINDGAILTSITDNNNNKLQFGYDTYGRVTNISVIPNGKSPISFLNLYYNDLGILAFIENSATQQQVCFEYSSTYNGEDISMENSGYLRRIKHTHKENSSLVTDAVASYEYDAKGRLISAYDQMTKYKLEYTYNGREIIGIVEKSGDNLSIGQVIALSYDINYTEIRNSGTDDIFGNADDRITVYVHDDDGRVISSYTTDTTRTMIYGAISGSYEDTENNKNNVKSSTVVGGSASNYIYNGGFEKSDQGWVKSSNVTISSTSNANGGHKSAYFSVNNNTTDELYQYVSLANGKYTVSMQIDTINTKNVKVQLIAQSMTNTGKIFIEEVPVNEHYASGTIAIASTTFDAEDNEIFKVSIKVIGGQISDSESVTISIDNVMLEKNIGHSGYSIVEFGNFENYSVDATGAINKQATDEWKYASNGESVTSTSSKKLPTSNIVESEELFGNSLKLKDEKAYQVVYEAEEDELADYTNMERTFVLSAFAKGTYQIANKDSNFKISLLIQYEEFDGYETVDMEFERNCVQWQFASKAFTISSDAAVRKIILVCEYSGHIGTGYFDNIYLAQSVDDSVVTNEYYSNGLLRAKKSGYYEEYYEYNDEKQLTRKANNNGELYDYTYNSAGDISTETFYNFTYNNETNYPYLNDNPDSLITKTPKRKTVYTYNQFGQQLSSDMFEVEYVNEVVTEVADTKHIVTRNLYITTDGSRIFGALQLSKDNLGRGTQYLYDENRGYMLAAIKPDGTGMCYEYDAIGNIISVQPANYASSGYSPVENEESVEYTYNDQQQLSTIKTGSTEYNFTYNVFGQNNAIFVGEDKIVSYQYNARNGKINKIVYENGFSVRYVYDEVDNIKEVWYTNNNVETKAFEYTYTSNGLLYRFDNLIEKTAVVYQYDLENRLVNYIEFDTETDINKFSFRCIYNDQGLVSGAFINGDYYFGNNVTDYEIGLTYEYNMNDLLKKYGISTESNTGSVDYVYDVYDRLQTKTTTFNSVVDSVLQFTNEVRYEYLYNNYGTSALISKYVTKVNDNTERTYTFTYDTNGNITEKVDSYGRTYRYVYDNLSQLIREDDVYGGFTYIYEYDNAGNIISKKKYSLCEAGATPTGSYTETTFTYGNAQWKDQLTSVNGNTITYDEVGNPLQYYNGYVFTWKNGNELASITNGTDVIYFSYDDAGIRTSKTVNNVKHTYHLNGSQILGEEWDNNLYLFLYDSEGTPLAIQYRNTTYTEGKFDTYWLEKNLQGDVIAIYAENGDKVAWYEYDAWGNQIDGGYSNGYQAIYQNNPFRYRGYFIDVETNLYYLNSRYYDSTSVDL